MDFPIRTLSKNEFPPLLFEIPDPPSSLYYRGVLPPDDMKLLTVVGSRNYSDYGRMAIDSLVGGLRGHNIGIVSGLAIGVDTLAHRAALSANLYTLAVPGSGIDESVLYPRRNRSLAREILERGGGLLSEYEPTFRATPWSFPKRNRIMAGIARATLVVEATERSGTLITSRLAVDYNRDVLTVPGNIFSENSKGPHMLIRLGATPVTSPGDILEALGIEESMPREAKPHAACSPEEEKVLDLLISPKDRDELIRSLGISATEANVLLMKMEMSGMISEQNGIFLRT